MKRAMKLLAVVMVLALTIAISAIPASAAMTPTDGSTNDTTTFTKHLVVASSADVPDVSFSYSIAPGTAVAATPTTYEIFAGIGNPTVSVADFDITDTTTAGVPGNASDTAHKFANDTVTVDFSGIQFPAPGVYRYVISEVNGGLAGVTYDANPRYLDVEVKNIVDQVTGEPTNALVIDGYVLRSEASAINTDGTYATNPGVKSDGFTNSYEDFDLTFSKQITGNQADKDATFQFVLSIANANPGVYNISVNGTTSTITVAADGTYTGNYTLGDGQYVTVTGLPTGATYTITETPGNYTASVATDGGAATAAATTSGTMNRDHSVEFTNTRQGTVPTGVLITIAPFAIGLLIFGAAIVFVVAKRRRESY